MSQTVIHRTPGIILVIFASLASGLYLWLARSVLVPISDRNGTEYVFVSAPIWTLTALALAALVSVLATHVLVRRLGTARALPQPAQFSYADVAYLSPLLCLAVSTLALLNLQPWFSNLPPLSYAIVDLRWWWTTLLLVWFASSLDQRLHGALRGWARQIQAPTAVKRWAPQLTLVVISSTCVIVGTPILRFSGATIGDESRYLRYCENWYQGLGFEVTNIQAIGDLPADFRPQVWRNFTLLAQVLPGELQSLARDTAAFVNEPSRRFNQAHGEGRFFTGKYGGVYQVHQPGISFLMFPAYYLDRQFGGPGRRANSQWPASLTAVNTFFLSLYALWTVLIFRFLRRTVETLWVPWVTTLAVALTMPLAAFPFQFYPELAAGVMLFAVALHLLGSPQRTQSTQRQTFFFSVISVNSVVRFARRGTPLSSFFYGVLAGYLPWLHVRFSVVAAVLAVAAAILLYGQKPRLAAFLAGFALPVACLALYAYRLTGSVLPTAMWPEDEGGVLSWNAMGRFSVSYLVDRNWGLFAYSPVYLLALPGYWWLARRRPDIFWLGAMLFLALLLPASAHSLGGGGTTPMRLILAVIPLAALPLAELLARYRESRLLKVIFGLLLVVSVENAFAYNLHHSKDRFQFIGPSFSGWKVNLLFPADAAAFQFASADGALLAGWLIALVALPLLPLLVRRAHMWAGRRTIQVRSTATLALATTIVAVLVATAVSAATGLRRHPRFQISAQAAREAIADRIRQNGECAICVSSTRGRVNMPP